MPGNRSSILTILLTLNLVVAAMPLAIPDRARAQDCAGDCNADDRVTIDELVVGRRIVRGDAELAECMAADVDASGTVTSLELEAATDDASGRCAPPAATPIPDPENQFPSINAGAISSNAGRVIQLDVSLFSANEAVYATQNYLTYGAGLSILAEEGAQPACQLVEDLTDAVASFAFGPDGCVPGDDCDRVIAYVDVSGSGEQIQSESLYRCQISVAADASPGFHPVMVLAPLATGETGAPFVTSAVSGGVVVRLPATETPTSTPTSTSTATETPTPTSSPTATETSLTTPTATFAIHTPTDVPTPTPTVADSSCAGDCDGDGTVDVSELVQGVGIALGTLSSDSCPAMSTGGGMELTIDELVLAVRNAIDGCGQAAL